MAKRNVRNKAITLMVAFAVAFTFMPMNSVNTYAASKAKKPSKPAITSMTVESSTITVKWKKAKNAKQYQVALKTYPKGWKYVKKVKKTKKNKKAYTKKGKYKVVKAKKGKYKVYRYQTLVKYKTLKGKTKSTKYSYKAPKRGTKYTLAVRSLNGKKKSAWCSKSVKTASKDAPHVHKWVQKSEKIKSGYACNGCSRDITDWDWDDMYDCCGGYHTHQWFIKPEYYTCVKCGAKKHKHEWYYTRPTYIGDTDNIFSEGYWVCCLCGNESTDKKTMEPLRISDKGFKCAAHYRWRTPYDFVEDGLENWILVDAYWQKKEDVPALDHISLEGNRSLSPGDCGKYKLTFTPSFATEKVKWKSTNPSVVSVDNKGNYKALAVGTAKIIATTVDTRCSDDIFVRVTNPNIGVVRDATMLINGESKPDSEIVLDGGGKKYQVTLKTKPVKAVYEVEFKFEEEDSDIVYQTSINDWGNLSSDSWELNPTFPNPQMEFKAYNRGTATIVAKITDPNFNKIELRQRVRVQ